MSVSTLSAPHLLYIWKMNVLKASKFSQCLIKVSRFEEGKLPVCAVLGGKTFIVIGDILSGTILGKSAKLLWR